MKQNNREIFNNLVTSTNHDVINEIKFRNKHREELRIRKKLACNLLVFMHKNNLTKSDLSSLLLNSTIDDILKGNLNKNNLCGKKFTI